jgi:hypothetical protein
MSFSDEVQVMVGELAGCGQVQWFPRSAERSETTAKRPEG